LKSCWHLCPVHLLYKLDSKSFTDEQGAGKRKLT
jgi:hypothetical protein